jgi:hypothetical protein
MNQFDRLITKPLAEAINLIFQFKVGEAVRPVVKHASDGNRVGIVLERRVTDRGLGVFVPEYLVRWSAPAGAASEPPAFHCEFELFKAI